MTNEAKVRVRIDTSRAKGELRALLRQSARTAGQVSGAVRGAVGRGLGAVGLGGGIGAGLAATRAATQSGFGDVIGESLGGLGAQLSEFFLGDLDEKARATRAAREETIQAFGAIAGQQGAVPPEARNFFQQVRTLRQQEETGRELFERDERFRGPGIGELIDRIMEGIGNLLSEAVDALAAKLNPFD